MNKYYESKGNWREVAYATVHSQKNTDQRFRRQAHSRNRAIEENTGELPLINQTSVILLTANVLVDSIPSIK
jgi:hypothetical protein